MKKVSVLCLLMLLGFLDHGFAVDAYAQLSKVTITSPTGTSIVIPRAEEYMNGDSMDITWEDEHLVSGKDFVVRWASPTKNYYSKKRFRVDAYYKLRYSFDGLSWEDIASNVTPSGFDGSRNQTCTYSWNVPVVQESRRCWVKVIGFDADGEKNGTDTQWVYIRVKPAVNVDIFYSNNGGETWRSITEVPYGNQYTWEDVSMKSRRCRFGAQLKVVMKDGGDKTVGSATSTEFTVMSNQPARLAGNWSGYYYSAPSGTIPVSGSIDSENKYNFVADLPFGKAKFLGRFYGNCLDADDDGTLAVTGDGTAYAPPGHDWSNDKPTAAIDLDAETNAALTAMKGNWTLGDDLVGSFAINRE
jgi:hypothetical protein